MVRAVPVAPACSALPVYFYLLTLLVSGIDALLRSLPGGLQPCRAAVSAVSALLTHQSACSTTDQDTALAAA